MCKNRQRGGIHLLDFWAIAWWVATSGPDPNSTITDAIATMLKETVFEFIKICMDDSIIKTMTNSISRKQSVAALFRR
jgi:hypothetical protein